MNQVDSDNPRNQTKSVDARSHHTLIGIMKIVSSAIRAGLAWSILDMATTQETSSSSSLYFRRVATFYTCMNLEPTCNDTRPTASEIVAASVDGRTLVYTDSLNEGLGWVDIADPTNPIAGGYVEVGGEPTSVGVLGDFAVVVINTSPNFVDVSGEMRVYDINTKELLATHALPGQPDSIGISPDGTRAVIAIENERDEDLGDGGLPQMPPGLVVVVDTSSTDPTAWTLTEVDVTGLDGVDYPEDPEPEFVSINSQNIAAVTLQENNAIVLIDTESYQVIDSFSLGTVDLSAIDTIEDGVISQTDSLKAVPRESDGVTWLGDQIHFATADEGDWNGGSRGFTIWDTRDGSVAYTSGTLLDHVAAQIGHYNDERSENKGNEPENVVFATYGGDDILVVVSERSSLLFVFNVDDPSSPKLIQTLPAGLGPEGTAAIPDRDLLVSAAEEDSREDGFRSSIGIYLRDATERAYPLIMSALRDDGTPIPFGALSGLAAPVCKGSRRYRHLANGGCGGKFLYTVEDSFYNHNRILMIDTEMSPPTIVDERKIKDGDSVFRDALGRAGFSDEAINSLINPDSTVNIDPEGLAVSEKLGFWLVHEGSGDAPDIVTPNILFRLNRAASISDVILLPEDVIAKQVSNGFEGVAEDGQYAVVILQRALQGEDHPRIGIYDTDSETWSFLFYPLDEVESANGGWVGLSDITALGNGYFLVLERDNQAGPDAVIKRVYLININEADEELSVLSKVLVKDLYPALKEATNGPFVEKVEGMAVDNDNNLWICTDNDGVDDSTGETILLNVGTLDLEAGLEGCFMHHG